MSDEGEEYLFAASMLMGIMQIIAGVIQLGQFVKLVPLPVRYFDENLALLETRT